MHEEVSVFPLCSPTLTAETEMPFLVPHYEGKCPSPRSQYVNDSAHNTEFGGYGRLFSLITHSRCKDIMGRIQLL